ALLTRAAWLRLDAGAARIQALRQALEASAARRDATRLGVEEGERTTLDRLDAEREYAQAGLALDRALAALALDRLRLRALAGALDEAALESINQALGPEPSPTRTRSTRP
ncbi:TolC family protein, partial [Castellaniella defragrans]